MADLPPGFHLRPATPDDHAAMQEISLKTGDSGQDGTHLQDDPTLLGLAYSVPYQVFAPEFAYVLEDAAGVCGYLLGVLDTAAFEDWMERVWYPPLRKNMRDPGPDPTRWSGSDWVRRRIMAPRRTESSLIRDYPAHGHIDLLPRARGQGLGRTLMQKLTDALRTAGVPGVFLEVGHHNMPAQAFYRQIGFTVLKTRPDAIIMVKHLDLA